MTTHPFPYIRSVAEKYGVYQVMVVDPLRRKPDRNSFINGLTTEDYGALMEVYREIEMRRDAPRISEWIWGGPEDEALKKERERAQLLFILFRALGDEWGIEPFSSGTVRLSPKPRPPLDWSKLPQNLAWLAAPAEKYGVHQTSDEVVELLTNAGPDEWAELRDLVVRCREHDDAIQDFIDAYPMTEHRESELIWFLLGVLDNPDFSE